VTVLCGDSVRITSSPDTHTINRTVMGFCVKCCTLAMPASKITSEDKDFFGFKHHFTKSNVPSFFQIRLAIFFIKEKAPLVPCALPVMNKF
jgi:hypothetical protein